MITLTHTAQEQTVTNTLQHLSKKKRHLSLQHDEGQRMARPRLPASSQRSAALLENTTVDYSEARFRGPDEGNDSLGDRLSYQCPAAAAATLKQVNKWSDWSGGKEDEGAVVLMWRGGGAAAGGKS